MIKSNSIYLEISWVGTVFYCNKLKKGIHFYCEQKQFMHSKNGCYFFIFSLNEYSIENRSNYPNQYKLHKNKESRFSLEQQLWEMLSRERPILETIFGLKNWLQVASTAFQRFPELLRKTASNHHPNYNANSNSSSKIRTFFNKLVGNINFCYNT